MPVGVTGYQSQGSSCQPVYDLRHQYNCSCHDPGAVRKPVHFLTVRTIRFSRFRIKLMQFSNGQFQPDRLLGVSCQPNLFPTIPGDTIISLHQPDPINGYTLLWCLSEPGRRKRFFTPETQSTLMVDQSTSNTSILIRVRVIHDIRTRRAFLKVARFAFVTNGLYRIGDRQNQKGEA